jgi:TfoX/Sxy family transcriptional regulator of competence genes
MASKQGTVDFIVGQMAGAGAVSAKKMFGEYAIYCDGKLVALVCDDQLFLKPTAGGRSFLGEVMEAPPYPGAKNCFLIGGEMWDEAERLAELVRISAAELPPPKAKKPPRSRKGKQGKA